MKVKIKLIALLFLCAVMSSCDKCEQELTLDNGFGDVTTESYKYGTIVNVYALPDKEDYKFFGWASTKNGNPEARNLCLTMDKDYTYYAIWTPMYTVTYILYYLENGSYQYKTKSYTSGTQITLNNEIKWNDNEVPPYLFLGWATDKDGKNMITEFTVTENIFVYGIWEKNIFHITFDLNGGSGTTPSEIMIKKGDFLQYSSLPTNGFSYGVYTFEGWSETKNGKVITSDFKPEKDMTLYAVWSHNGQVKDKTDDN